jgi:hypothetical protein
MRLLRALASLGVLEEVEINLFALTAMGAQLRSDAPDSVRNLALMFGGERTWQLWGDLLGSIQTGESATQRLYAVGSFEYSRHIRKRLPYSTRQWPKRRVSLPTL